MYQNVRGLRSKLSEVYKNICTVDSKFLCVSETWLAEDVLNNELVPSFYCVYRSDRDFTSCQKGRGGGVLFGHHQDIKCRRIPTREWNFPPEIDLVCVRTSNLVRNITFVVLYVPPDIHQSAYDEFIDSLSFLYTDLGDQILIVGDFNTPYFQSPCDGRSRSLQRFAEFSGLQQCNFVKNSLNRSLDLVFSSLGCIVTHSDESIVAEDPLHPTLLLEIASTSNTPNCEVNIKKARFNFRRADLPSLYAAIHSTNWTSMSNYRDVDSLCGEFYNLLLTSLEAHVPLLKPKRNANPIWYSRELVTLMRSKERARQFYNKHKSDEAYSNYSTLRSQVKRLLSATYKHYILTSEEKIKSDPKQFWGFVSSKRQSTRIPGEMFLNSTSIIEPQEIVDAFAQNFSSVFLPASSSATATTISTKNSIIHISDLAESDIIVACKALRPTLTSGPDNIPAFLVKDCAHILAKPLSALFNHCIQTGEFPDHWKLTNICPIFKDGNKADITNYRPISLISNFSKVFEKAILNKIHTQIYSKLSIHQHGFFRNRSTSSNLVCLTQYISERLDGGGQVDVIYTDFAKAFDKVDHTVLLNKLRCFGFSDNLVKLLMSYLYNRSCSVTYNGYYSLPFITTSGVPQGSVLGPTLFLIFINDLADSLNCHRLLFADDLKIFSSIESEEDCRALQQQLNVIDHWCKVNRLLLNINKCKVVSYTKRSHPVIFNYLLDNYILLRTTNINDLGVVFDVKLRFHLHVEYKVKAAFKMLGFVLRTCKDITNVDCIKILYFSFVRSILEYACMVWDPFYKCHIDLVESVQRRFLKYLHFRKHRSYPPRGYPQIDLINEFDFLTLDVRRKFFDLKFLIKILNGVLDMDQVYFKLAFVTREVNTRQKQLFKIPYARTNLLIKSPLVRMCHLANNLLPVFDITNVKIGEFKLISVGQLLVSLF